MVARPAILAMPSAARKLNPTPKRKPDEQEENSILFDAAFSG
jgi:hypothetical protein